MNATDPSAAVAGALLGLLLLAALYVWSSLAFAAVFRKSGVEPWKAWVPILNTVVILQLAGLSPWLLLLVLVPVLGAIALIGVFAVAFFRLSSAFGYGAGMAVLGVLLSPAWASVVGWGSARWVGREQARRLPASPPHAAHAARGHAAPATPPAASTPATVSAAGALDGWAPQPSADRPATPRAWQGFEAPDVTGEVTGAVSGAPSPIAAVPFTPQTPPPTQASVPPRPVAAPDDELGVPAAIEATPPVTRVPPGPSRPPVESWAPARSPLAEADAFPEESGPVSAVFGAPDAGTPRSARGAVSAQHVLPQLPDDLDETVMAVRRRVHWSLLLPTGAAVELTGDVVLVGRRPTPSTAYPDAQLIEVDDGTVSKTHLRLERDGDIWTVTDLHSTNGTILIASDGAEREIQPGNAHRAPERMLAGDAELRLTADATPR